jgi:hypothetical protein
MDGRFPAITNTREAAGTCVPNCWWSAAGPRPQHFGMAKVARK